MTRRCITISASCMFCTWSRRHFVQLFIYLSRWFHLYCVFLNHVFVALRRLNVKLHVTGTVSNYRIASEFKIVLNERIKILRSIRARHTEYCQCFCKACVDKKEILSYHGTQMRDHWVLICACYHIRYTVFLKISQTKLLSKL